MARDVDRDIADAIRVKRREPINLGIGRSGGAVVLATLIYAGVMGVQEGFVHRLITSFRGEQQVSSDPDLKPLKSVTRSPQDVISPTSSSTPTILELDPITVRYLDCRKADITAYPDPKDGSYKRAGPGENFDPIDGLYSGEAFKVEYIARISHIEGNSRDWAIDYGSIPEENLSHSLRSSYMLLAPYGTNRPGLGINKSLELCEPVTK